MSKRYGRKRKFKHRKLIAELGARLSRESTAHMYLPGPGVPELEKIARVVVYGVTEYGGSGQIIERSATVTVETIEAVYEMIRNQNTVQFMGKQYTIVNGRYDAPHQYAVVAGPSYCELELTGVG